MTGLEREAWQTLELRAPDTMKASAAPCSLPTSRWPRSPWWGDVEHTDAIDAGPDLARERVARVQQRLHGEVRICGQEAARLDRPEPTGYGVCSSRHGDRASDAPRRLPDDARILASSLSAERPARKYPQGRWSSRAPSSPWPERAPAPSRQPHGEHGESIPRAAAKWALVWAGCSLLRERRAVKLPRATAGRDPEASPNLGSSFGAAIPGTILVSVIATGNRAYAWAMVALALSGSSGLERRSSSLEAW